MSKKGADMGVEHGTEMSSHQKYNRLTSQEIDYLERELARYGFKRMSWNVFYDLKDNSTIILNNGMFYFGEGIGDAGVRYDYRIVLRKNKEGIEVKGDGGDGVDHLPLARTCSGYINGGENGFVLTKDNKMFARFAFVGEFVSYVGPR